jgi:hypothetical protein
MSTVKSKNNKHYWLKIKLFSTYTADKLCVHNRVFGWHIMSELDVLIGFWRDNDR